MSGQRGLVFVGDEAEVVFDLDSLREDTKGWVVENPDAARRLFRKTVEAHVATLDIQALKPESTIDVEADARFVASDNFVVDLSNTATVKTYQMLCGFPNLLAKVEEGVKTAAIKVSPLLHRSSDERIIIEMGDRHEVKLAHYFQALKQQGHGQEGKLQVNGKSICAYIRDANGVLWVVSAFWYKDRGGWSIRADLPHSSPKWPKDFQFLYY